MALDLQHPLFELIRAEHEQIRKLLSELSYDVSLLKKLMELWVFAELRHHTCEEKILFSELAKHPRIKEGGPRCTYFFDAHQMHHPVQNVESLLKTKIEIEPHQKDFYSRNLPVAIPTDEHRAGKTILHFLIENFEQVSNGKKQSLLLLYESIQLTHLQKEETCLFHLCTNVLSTSDADLILQRWNEFVPSVSI